MRSASTPGPQSPPHAFSQQSLLTASISPSSPSIFTVTLSISSMASCFTWAAIASCEVLWLSVCLIEDWVFMCTFEFTDKICRSTFDCLNGTYVLQHRLLQIPMWYIHVKQKNHGINLIYPTVSTYKTRYARSRCHKTFTLGGLSAQCM